MPRKAAPPARKTAFVKAVKAVEKTVEKAKQPPKSSGGQMMRSGGGKLGSLLGEKLLGNFGLGSLGSALGKQLGELAGSGLSKITGFGSYYEENTVADALKHVASGGNPASFRVPEGQQAPSFSTGTGGTRVAHREAFLDLVVPSVPTAFDVSSFVVNPGNAELFPWLATIAQCYQQYRIHGLVFHYEPLTSEIAAGGPMGSVSLATNYNASDNNFSSITEILSSQYATSGKPSKVMLHILECDPKVTTLDVLYIKSGSTASTSSSDARMFDFANFQIATEGLPGAQGETLGRIWVSYDIELLKPRLPVDPVSWWILENGVGNTVTKLGWAGIGPRNGGQNYLGSGLRWTDSLNVEFAFSGDYVLVVYSGGTGVSSSTHDDFATNSQGYQAERKTYAAGSTKIISVYAGTCEDGDIFNFGTGMNATTIDDVQIMVFRGNALIGLSGSPLMAALRAFLPAVRDDGFVVTPPPGSAAAPPPHRAFSARPAPSPGVRRPYVLEYRR